MAANFSLITEAVKAIPASTLKDIALTLGILAGGFLGVVIVTKIVAFAVNILIMTVHFILAAITSLFRKIIIALMMFVVNINSSAIFTVLKNTHLDSLLPRTTAARVVKSNNQKPQWGKNATKVRYPRASRAVANGVRG